MAVRELVVVTGASAGIGPVATAAVDVADAAALGAAIAAAEARFGPMRTSR